MVNAAFRLQFADINYILTHPEDVDVADELFWRLQSLSSTDRQIFAGMPTVTSVQSGSVASFPLRMRHTSTYIGHRVALVGDAAHTTHPLAGQGLNLGLADAESLSERIVHGVETGMDIGSSWCLESYDSDRWAKNNAVLGVCDKLQKLYSAQSGPVVWARSLGLDLVNNLGPLKGALTSIAGGTR